MPWLPIYAVAEDLRALFRALSDDAEVAFLVAADRGIPSVGRHEVRRRRWRAVPSATPPEAPARLALWHVPSGALPLVPPEVDREPGRIDDPWKGWRELQPGADPSVPYFGAGHPGILWLNARPAGQSADIGLSSFEWIGNRYRAIGSPAHPDTEKWWRRLGRAIRQQAEKIPRSGPLDGPKPEIWALPGALERIRAGASRDDNP